MNVLAERSLSHVQGLELCGQGHPPITRATGESSIQGAWGKEWSCWGKYQSLGSIVLAFTLAKEAIFCLRKFKKIELISLWGLVISMVCKQSPDPSCRAVLQLWGPLTLGWSSRCLPPHHTSGLLYYYLIMPYIFIRLGCLKTSVYIPYPNKIVLVLVAGPISKCRFYFCCLVSGNFK